MASPLKIQNLESALADGAFKKRLNAHNINYWNPSVVTAIGIIEAIKRHRASGIESWQIAQEMKMSCNTMNLYLVWLRKAKLIESVEQVDKQGKPILYFPCK